MLASTARESKRLINEKWASFSEIQKKKHTNTHTHTHTHEHVDYQNEKLIF
jgi:hypothetical protein